MEAVYIYILKSILVSGILMGYYWLALRNTRFHYYNRFYLISTIMLSLVLPMLDFNWFTVYEPSSVSAKEVLIFIDRPGRMVPSEKAFSYEKLLFVGLLLISFVLVAMMIHGIRKIYSIKSSAKVTPMEGFDFIETQNEDAPFSFFKNLFWRDDINLNDETGRQILRHELTHMEQHHTHDKLFISFLSAMFWMNPFFWIIRKELEVIHEFIADEKAVTEEDASALAAMLLQTHYQSNFLSTGQSFFYSSIKRRIIMLTSSKKTSYSYLRRLLVLPIAAGLVILSSFTVKQFNSPEIRQNDLVSDSRSIDAYDTTGKKFITKVDTVGKGYTVSWNGDWAIFKDPKTKKEIFRARRQDLVPPPPPPLSANGKMKFSVDSIRFSADSLFFVQGTNIAGTPLIVVDGVPTDNMNAIKPTDIESITVLKDPSSKALYGTRGANGVLLLTTKKGKSGAIAATPNNNEPITVVGHPLPKNQDGTITVVGHPLPKTISPKEIIAQGEGTANVFTNDGYKLVTIKTFDKSIADKAFEKQDVVTINIMEEGGKKMYIITKREKTEDRLLPSDVLYILDGKEISKDEMKGITPDKIQSMNILKGENATGKYGEKAKNGVIEIISKKN